jgi:hypothetical protein
MTKTTLHLDDHEFLDQCIKYNTDPTVQRLCKILLRYDDLVLDIDSLITVDYTDRTVLRDLQGVPLADYFTDLISRNDGLEEELDEAHLKIHRLESRTLVEIAQEFQNKLDSKDGEIGLLRSNLKHAAREAEYARDKLSMWTILNTENLN